MLPTEPTRPEISLHLRLCRRASGASATMPPSKVEPFSGDHDRAVAEPVDPADDEPARS